VFKVPNCSHASEMVPKSHILGTISEPSCEAYVVGNENEDPLAETMDGVIWE